MKLLNVSQLAQLSGLDRKTVTKYLKDVPYESKESSKLYKLTSAIPVLFSMVKKDLNEADPITLQKKKEELENERLKNAKLKIELAVLQNKYVTVDEVTEAVEKEYTYVRKALLSIPNKCALFLSRENDPGKIQNILDEQINEALEHLTKDRSFEEQKTYVEENEE